jgi:hypothetical protein
MHHVHERLGSVVARIAAGDDSAIAELYGILETGVRFFVRRAVGENTQTPAIVDQVLADGLFAIRTSAVCNESELLRYVMRLVRLLCAEQRCHQLQHAELESSRLSLLQSVSEQDRQALNYFYVEGRSSAEICTALAITPERLEELRVASRSSFLHSKKSVCSENNSTGHEDIIRDLLIA